MVLGWPCIPGWSYLIQSCTDLTLAAWTNVTAQPVVGSPSGMGLCTTSMDSAGSEFYRLKIP
jgi:hypothetical protein